MVPFVGFDVYIVKMVNYRARLTLITFRKCWEMKDGSILGTLKFIGESIANNKARHKTAPPILNDQLG